MATTTYRNITTKLTISFFLFFSPVFSQGYFGCEQYSTIRFDSPPQSTLCEEYGSLPVDIEIGTGTITPFVNRSRSSLLPSVLSGIIRIKGNFYVDNAFMFKDAIIQIDLGATIFIENGSSFDFPYGTAGLSIDNSKLFCCNGMWEGIRMGNLTYINTSNNSTIEDADKAIRSDQPTSLSITERLYEKLYG